MPPSTIPLGTLLIHTYRVERLLGSGGMGEVYLAQHVGLGTWHAVKVIRPALFSNQQVLDLFRREATVLRGVRHDAIVSYDGFLRDATGRDYLVMEYVEGPSLSDRIRRDPLSVGQTLALRDRLAEGLAEAHRNGAIHRDISPDNVILPEGRLERAKLIDFGLCKLTDPTQQTIVGSAFAGKYRFASPEQLGLFGAGVDARSDVYSLGLVLAAATLGRPLEMGDSFDAVVQARRRVPDLRGVPDALREQLRAMLQPDPADRPQTLAELLRRWPARGGTEEHSRRIGSAGPDRVQVRPRRWWLGGALAGTTLLLLAAGAYWLLRSPAPLDAGAEKEVVETETRKMEPSVDELAELPWQEAAPHFRGWVARGHFDDAFALLRDRVAHERPIAAEETYRFAQDLMARGRLNEAFALLQVIGKDGYADAALAVGEMYDPVLWSPTSSPFSSANPRKAEAWYRRALELGAVNARVRLEALESWKRQPGGAGKDAG